MKRIRALVRVGRFTVPAVVTLEPGGVIRISYQAIASEAFRLKGSLSSREVSNLLQGGWETLVRASDCRLSIRRVRRRIDALDGSGRRMLELLGVDVPDLVRGGARFYDRVYLVRITREGQDLSLMVDERSARILKSYVSRLGG